MTIIPHKKPNNNFFTIIELLVVIAIITVLGSFLLPAILNAKDKSKEALCSSNLQQLSQALSLYVGDYTSLPTGRIPPVFISSSSWEGQNYSTLAGFSARHLTFFNINWIENDCWVDDKFFWGSASVYQYVKPYIGNARTLGICPGVETWNFAEWNNACFGTTSKATYVWYGGASGRSLAGEYYPRTIDNPIHPESSTWGFHDPGQENNPSAIWLFSDVGIWDNTSPNYGDAPHGKGTRANKLYTDGHVETGVNPQRPFNWGYLRQNATGF